MSLSEWAREDPNTCATRNEVRSTQSDLAWSTPPSRPWMTGDFRDRCAIMARRVAAQLGGAQTVIVREPFVLAGDLSVQELDEWHGQTILPTMTAMQHDYFDTEPVDPITILMFSSEATYRRQARRLFSETQVSIYGFYQPATRTIVVNLSAGGGTLVHELTHALLDFDFPDVPIWFNEGLASLHEHCVVEDGLHGATIRPLMNWRLPILQQAIAEGRLQPLPELMQTDDFQGSDEALLYAQARYFCFFLAERGQLRKFYQMLHAAADRDPQGTVVARQCFPGQTWAQFEREFRAWVMRQSYQVGSAG